ncbi:hypothetical protein [Prosthecobacter sp.]|uniref:hypothetical protein n=1 Tax=Prosthecobacter sp. TaxID=1965333 RepID=UPI002AB991A5|nr:hypothetical protein [Prosthecobacter sp.]MDZ4405330.1 hypothetical protein [Prosthecobacter sp.]
MKRLLQLCTSLALTLLALICTSTSADVPQHAEKAEEGALPLPRWSEQELRAFRESLPSANDPGVLLPGNGGPITDINELLRTPVSSGPRLDHFFNNQDGELSPRLRSEDMRLFLPESILGQPIQNQTNSARIPTPLSSLKEVPPEFLAACAQALPKEYLIDPDLLVPEMQNHDMMRFLEFHARDARIKLSILIIAHDCKLPEGSELGKIASGSLLQTDASLLVYPLGEPWRARLFVSKSVHDQTSTEFLSETIQACLHEALQASDVHDQLHRYAVHLSTRLFWLQRALGTAPTTEVGKDQPLAEVTPEVKTTVQHTTSVLFIVIWSSASLLMLGVAGVAGRQFHRHLRLRRQSRVWILPEPETVPRLGGAFTGGGGGMIRYA